MELNLISNNFEKNKAINGGALYLADGIKLNNDEDRKINIENNIFDENIAEDFGGAIYSNFSKLYLSTTKNNTISLNKAGIMGGGLYTPNSIDKNLFDITDTKFINNTVNSDINDYTSMPAYINLDTTLSKNPIDLISGDSLSLIFSVYDEYNNTIKDITKYYSSVLLNIMLEEKNNELMKRNKNQKYKLTGNISTFINGKIK